VVGFSRSLLNSFVSIDTHQIFQNRKFPRQRNGWYRVINLVDSHFSLSKVNLGAVDLAVQEEGVGSKESCRQPKDDGEGGSGCAASGNRSTGSAGDLSCSLVQVGENVVDVVTSAGIGVIVLSKVISQLGFTLGSHFVRLLTELGRFVVLVVVLVVVVVVVVIVAVVIVISVVINLEARETFAQGYNRFARVRKRRSVVEGLVNTTSGGGRASRVKEHRQIDALSILRGARSADVILAVHVNSVAALAGIIVVSTVVIVVVISIGTLHFCNVVVQPRKR